MKVIKNCLVKFVLEGIEMEGVSLFLKGLVVIVYVKDLVGVLKVVVDYVKDNDNFVVFGGFFGVLVFDLDGIMVFFKMLFFDELCGFFVGVLNVFVGKFVRIFNVLLGNFVIVFDGVGYGLVYVLWVKVV